MVVPALATTLRIYLLPPVHTLTFLYYFGIILYTENNPVFSNLRSSIKMSIWLILATISFAVYGVSLGGVLGTVHSITSNGLLFRKNDYRLLLRRCIYATVAMAGLFIISLCSSEAPQTIASMNREDGLTELIIWLGAIPTVLALFYLYRFNRARDD